MFNAGCEAQFKNYEQTKAGVSSIAGSCFTFSVSNLIFFRSFAYYKLSSVKGFSDKVFIKKGGKYREQLSICH